MTATNIKQVSVIIPTYNRSELLSQTLKTLCNQSIAKESFEVIVVDDGSSDSQNLDLIKDFETQLDILFVYQSDKGFRAGQARNLGVRVAQGDICIFIDTGMLLPSYFLQNHLETHQSKDQNIAVVGRAPGFTKCLPRYQKAIIEIIDNSEVDDAISQLNIDDNFDDMRHSLKNLFTKEPYSYPAPWSYFWTCNVSIKKQDLLNINLFDEGYVGWGYEDIDLGYRLFQSGVDIVFDSKAEAIHYPHTRDEDSLRQIETRNRDYFLTKFPHLQELIIDIGLFDVNEHINDKIAQLKSQNMPNVEISKLTHTPEFFLNRN